MLVCHPGLLNPLWLGCHPGGSGMPAPLWTADPPWLLFPCLPQGPLPRLPLVWVHTRPASVIVFPLPSVPCTPTSLSLACALSPRALLFPLTSWCHSPEDYGGGLSPHPCPTRLSPHSLSLISVLALLSGPGSSSLLIQELLESCLSWALELGLQLLLPSSFSPLLPSASTPPVGDVL